MRQRRTDLALEAKELWEESARQTARLEGVEAFTETREGFLTETVHILVFTLHPGEEPLVHARMFGPANGVAEDPVTGIANGPMGAYLVRNGLIPAEGDEVRFTAVQGEAMGRPGSMEVRVALEDGQPGEIQIVGDAVVAFQTTLELDA